MTVYIIQCSSIPRHHHPTVQTSDTAAPSVTLPRPPSIDLLGSLDQDEPVPVAAPKTSGNLISLFGEEDPGVGWSADNNTAAGASASSAFE